MDIVGLKVSFSQRVQLTAAVSMILGVCMRIESFCSLAGTLTNFDRPFGFLFFAFLWRHDSSPLARK